MSKPNDYDTYIIPPTFIEGGTFFGGLLKLRNTAEALVIVLAIGIPVFSVSTLTLTAKIIILCLTALPLGIIALVGINGSGKSTLFKALMGFVHVGKGDIAILGQPVNRALRQNLVAYVPQAEEVDWSFPVLVEDVVMMGRYGHMGWLRRAKPRDHEIVDAALARVGMSEYRHRQIGELSGGQKKRVFLARAIAQQGKVILLDEPFTGVDVQTEARIIELLRELRDEGCTMLVSTHNLGSVSEFCDYTVMVKGTVLASGPTESTFTAENLELAFSGVLRHVVLSGAEERIITDDERPFISRRAAGGER